MPDEGLTTLIVHLGVSRGVNPTSTSTVADAPWLVALSLYPPEIPRGNVTVVDARPLAPVVPEAELSVGVVIPGPAPSFVLNVTVCPDEGLPFC